MTAQPSLFVEIPVAATLYFSFAAFLVFPHLGAPAVFGKMAISLCAAELVSTLVWLIARDACPDGSCAVMETAEYAASVDIPAATGLSFLIALAYGLFVARNW
jgi:hypothetical protein